MQNQDSKNLAIGVLSTTAVMLLAAFLIVQSRPVPVLADGMSIIQGDYSISVGGITQDSEDLLYIVDSSQKKLNVYRFDLQRKQVNLVQTLSLDEMRKAGGVQPPKPKKP